MSKPRTATRGFRVSSPRRGGCCGQEGIWPTADIRPITEIDEWEAQLADSGMREISHKEITPEVLRGIDRNTAKSKALVKRHMPPGLRYAGNNFIGTTGSPMYKLMASGDISYRMYCFIKD